MCQNTKLHFSSSTNHNYIDSYDEDWFHDANYEHAGPEHCEDCRTYGSIVQDNIKIFIGYCVTCAEKFDFNRGPGFYGFEYETLARSYEYPEYLLHNNYKNIIIELSKNQM